MTRHNWPTLPDSVSIEILEGDYPVLKIANSLATAKVALHGAHLYQFKPKGQDPVIWTSETAVYKQGKAIRGGIPICWPWFGPHQNNSELPAHGFARNDFWVLNEAQQLESGSTLLSFKFNHSENSKNLWPHDFGLELTLLIGRELKVELTMVNLSNQEQNFTTALHSYFCVSDIKDISIAGLENTTYIDSLQNDERFKQQGAIRFSEELDRIYCQTPQTVTIHDPGLSRAITIEKSGSLSTVVWNPWIDKSSNMNDFEIDGYQRMVCVETCNAGDDIITLAPNQPHRISTTISVQKL